ncbi:MAG TPA: hypothetical protein VLK36_00805 [Gaiellaceae bacterium]|nr:hypothetical protein [Gaiellaceae bacterium]
MQLPLPAPYDFPLSTERFRRFGVDLANLWDGDELVRAVDGREVRIRAAPAGVDVEPLDDRIRPDVLHLLGASFDLDAFYAWAEPDEILGPLTVRLAGLRPPLVPDPFEALVSSITAQQVSLFSAFAIRSRMIERFGRRLGRVYAFPTRERLARASEDELFAVGFSRRKAEYVVGLARNDLDLEALAGLDDDGVRAAIVAVRGLGAWTAEWFLARHLGRSRAWPAGDLALRKAVEVLYGVGVEEMRSKLEPFQNLSAHYLLTGARNP